MKSNRDSTTANIGPVDFFKTQNRDVYIEDRPLCLFADPHKKVTEDVTLLLVFDKPVQEVMSLGRLSNNNTNNFNSYLQSVDSNYYWNSGNTSGSKSREISGKSLNFGNSDKKMTSQHSKTSISSLPSANVNHSSLRIKNDNTKKNMFSDKSINIAGRSGLNDSVSSSSGYNISGSNYGIRRQTVTGIGPSIHSSKPSYTPPREYPTHQSNTYSNFNRKIDFLIKRVISINACTAKFNLLNSFKRSVSETLSRVNPSENFDFPFTYTKQGYSIRAIWQLLDEKVVYMSKIELKKADIICLSKIAHRIPFLLQFEFTTLCYLTTHPQSSYSRLWKASQSSFKSIEPNIASNTKSKTPVSTESETDSKIKSSYEQIEKCSNELLACSADEIQMDICKVSTIKDTASVSNKDSSENVSLASKSVDNFLTRKPALIHNDIEDVFEILDDCGSGNFATVFKAQFRRDKHHTLAIKLINQEVYNEAIDLVHQEINVLQHLMSTEVLNSTKTQSQAIKSRNKKNSKHRKSSSSSSLSFSNSSSSSGSFEFPVVPNDSKTIPPLSTDAPASTFECIYLTDSDISDDGHSCSDVYNLNTFKKCLNSSSRLSLDKQPDFTRSTNGSQQNNQSLTMSHTSSIPNFNLVEKRSDLNLALKQGTPQKKLLKKRKTIELRTTHNNIIAYFGSIYDESRGIALMMEYANGGDLFNYIAMQEPDPIVGIRKLSEVKSAHILNQIFSAVEYLHSKNIVHRDIKPENILLNYDSKCICLEDEQVPTIKLGDFGLATIHNKNDPKVTPLLGMCGTPYYVAPEMLLQIGYDERIDIWAVGIILHIMVVGYPPFSSADDDQNEIFEKIIEADIDFNNIYTEELTDLCKIFLFSLLTVDPDERISIRDAFNSFWFKNML